jgi:hypothetical protein
VCPSLIHRKDLPPVPCPDACLAECKPCDCWPEYLDARRLLDEIILRATQWRDLCPPEEPQCRLDWQAVIDEATQCRDETDEHRPTEDGAHRSHTCQQLYEHVVLAREHADRPDGALCCLTELNHDDAGGPLATPPVRAR